MLSTSNKSPDIYKSIDFMLLKLNCNKILAGCETEIGVVLKWVLLGEILWLFLSMWLGV